MIKIHPGTVGYYIDVVLCVDLSTFVRYRIPEIREAIALFGRHVIEQIHEKYQSVASLRIKVIAFKDVGVDSEPIVASDFFEMDENGYSDDLRNFVERTVTVAGVHNGYGGALDALSLAMDSEWSTVGALRRQVVVLFTEADRGVLGSCYSENGASGGAFDSLHDKWENVKMEMRAKRLLVFAPLSSGIDGFADWTNTFVTDSGGDVPDEIINVGVQLVVNSI